MAEQSFSKQIEAKLKGLTRAEIVKFAWVAALRVLPFLATKGDFSFWKKKEEKVFLFNIFYAIDTAGSIPFSVSIRAKL